MGKHLLALKIPQSQNRPKLYFVDIRSGCIVLDLLREPTGHRSQNRHQLCRQLSNHLYTYLRVYLKLHAAALDSTVDPKQAENTYYHKVVRHQDQDTLLRVASTKEHHNTGSIERVHSLFWNGTFNFEQDDRAFNYRLRSFSASIPDQSARSAEASKEVVLWWQEPNDSIVSKLFMAETFSSGGI